MGRPSEGTASLDDEATEGEWTWHRLPVPNRCQHGGVTKTSSEQPRAATEDDGPRLLSLWSMLFDDDADEEWKANAIRWFARSVGGASSA